ncbi:hypothetical protein C8R44DRAFT_753352 [Mycena epipterygia]|nr:hypothetical protein C8R44DRAFT_753352 [Mycena epipterygia]
MALLDRFNSDLWNTVPVQLELSGSSFLAKLPHTLRPDGLKFERIFPLIEGFNLHVGEDGFEILRNRQGRTSAAPRWLSPKTHFDLEKGGKSVHLPSVLNGIAHFHYFLERNNGKELYNNGDVPSPDFALEMHRLQGTYPTCTPIDSEKGNMIESGKVHFLSDPKAEYGFTMRNTSGEDLFPYLFYFDPDTYRILCWYSPEDANGRPPLFKTQGKVNVGMGGEYPYSFAFPPKDKSNSKDRSSSGFLKLFVSTEYLDFNWIEQTTSPFDPKFQALGRLDGFRVKHVGIKNSKWNAIEVVLTMGEE